MFLSEVTKQKSGFEDHGFQTPVEKLAHLKRQLAALQAAKEHYWLKILLVFNTNRICVVSPNRWFEMYGTAPYPLGTTPVIQMIVPTYDPSSPRKTFYVPNTSEGKALGDSIAKWYKLGNEMYYKKRANLKRQITRLQGE